MNTRIGARVGRASAVPRGIRDRERGKSDVPGLRGREARADSLPVREGEK